MSNIESIDVIDTCHEVVEIQGNNEIYNKNADVSPLYKSHLASLPGRSYQIDGETYSVKLLQSEADWPIYKSIWDSLVKASPNHNLFQSFDFLYLWWQYFAEDKKLYILFICKDDELIGFASFNILKRKIRGLSFDEVGFIGSPMEVDRPSLIMTSKRNSITYHSGIKAIVQFLTDNRKDWDLIQIFEQENDAALDVMKQAFKNAGLWLGHKWSSQCYYLDCTQPWDSFIATKSRKFKKNLRAAKRKLENQGDLEYQVYRNWSEVKQQLDIYRDIEGRSHKESEGVGIAKSQTSLEFYYQLAETFANKGDFCIRVLTLDNKPIVATFGIYYDKVFYSLQITHDKEYNKASPGTYLESVELEECYNEKDCDLYDFLGAFVNNKSRWSSTYKQTESLHIYQRSPVLTTVFATHFLLEPLYYSFYNWVYSKLQKNKKST